MNGVHDSHGGGLFAEWILGRANFLPGIVEVRKRNGSFQNFSLSVGMKQKRAELIAEPKGPVFRFLKGLDIEVRAGQHPATREFVGDGERDIIVGIMKFDKALNVDPAAAAVFGFKVRADLINAKVEVC